MIRNTHQLFFSLYTFFFVLIYHCYGMKQTLNFPFNLYMFTFFWPFHYSHHTKFALIPLFILYNSHDYVFIIHCRKPPIHRLSLRFYNFIFLLFHHHYGMIRNTHQLFFSLYMFFFVLSFLILDSLFALHPPFILYNFIFQVSDRHFGMKFVLSPFLNLYNFIFLWFDRYLDMKFVLSLIAHFYNSIFLSIGLSNSTNFALNLFLNFYTFTFHKHDHFHI